MEEPIEPIESHKKDTQDTQDPKEPKEPKKVNLTPELLELYNMLHRNLDQN